MSFKFEIGKILGIVTLNKSRDQVSINGTIKEKVKNSRLEYSVAAPPSKNSSFSGSGLPFPNQEMAFSANSTSSFVELDADNSFSLTFPMPNSYYKNLGSILVPPEVYIKYSNFFATKTHTLKLWDGIANRTLTYDCERKGPNFYDTYPLPIRTQEAILNSKAYTINKA